MSAPYWSDDQDLTAHGLPDAVAGVLSQSATETTKPYTVDEGALKTYVRLSFFSFFFSLFVWNKLTGLQVLRENPPHPSDSSRLKRPVFGYSP